MLDAFNTLQNLLTIDKYRQQEMDDIFSRMGNHPTKRELTLLFDTATSSVAEGEALLTAIKASLSRAGSPALTKLIPEMLMQLHVLPQQIEMDRKLVTYLQQEYS